MPALVFAKISTRLHLIAFQIEFAKEHPRLRRKMVALVEYLYEARLRKKRGGGQTRLVEILAVRRHGRLCMVFAEDLRPSTLMK